MAPCNFIHSYQLFNRARFLHLPPFIGGEGGAAAYSSKMLIPSHPTTRRHMYATLPLQWEPEIFHFSIIYVIIQRHCQQGMTCLAVPEGDAIYRAIHNSSKCRSAGTAIVVSPKRAIAQSLRWSRICPLLIIQINFSIRMSKPESTSCARRI
jgi:hypothetical protein